MSKEMTTREFKATLAEMESYSITNREAIHTKPIKGVSVHYGATGIGYEGEVKTYLGYTRSGLGSRKSQHSVRSDLYAQGLVLEIKHHCGEIEILFDGTKVDYVAYCPDYIEGMDINACTYVMSKENFIKVLQLAGLIREKKTTAGTVKRAIQSYKNSNKRFALFLDLLDEYNEMSLADYKALLEARKQARKAGRR